MSQHVANFTYKQFLVLCQCFLSANKKGAKLKTEFDLVASSFLFAIMST